jgi:hypothetical protein
MTAMSRARHSAAIRSSSSWVANDPVGLFGDTSSSARVRALIARSTLDRSIVQVIGNRGHEIEPCQVLEQRIARLGDEHFVAGPGQQLEQQRVRLAGARGQHDAARVDTHALPLVVARHGFPRVESTERSRVVAERFGIGE